MWCVADEAVESVVGFTLMLVLVFVPLAVRVFVILAPDAAGFASSAVGWGLRGAMIARAQSISRLGLMLTRVGGKGRRQGREDPRAKVGRLVLQEK